MPRIFASILMVVLIVLLPASIASGSEPTRLSEVCTITDLTNGAPQTCAFSSRKYTQAYLWVATSDEVGSASVSFELNLQNTGFSERSVCVFADEFTINQTKVFFMGSGETTAGQQIAGVCKFPLSGSFELEFSETLGAGATIDIAVQLEYLSH